MTKKTISRSLTACAFALLGFGCAADAEPVDPLPEAADAPATEQKVGVQSSALRVGGGLGVATCPGGGSPSCTACADGETCTYSCTGGYYCDIGPIDDGGSQCSPKGTCMSFSGGFGGFGGGVIRL